MLVHVWVVSIIFLSIGILIFMQPITIQALPLFFPLLVSLYRYHIFTHDHNKPAAITF